MSTAEVATPPEVTPSYRISVLATGLRRMWRATAVALPVIVVNALAQGLLVLPTQGAFTPPVLIITAACSAALLLVTVGLLATAALLTYPPTAPRPSWRTALPHFTSGLARFASWTSALFVVSAAGFAFWFWPGALVLALGLFIPLAAADGASPLRATWAIVRSRPVRWLVTVLVVLVVALVAAVLTAVQWFFVPLYVGVAFAVLVWGVLLWWWLTGLAALYLDVAAND